MKPYILPVLLQILGFVVVVAEVFIPSMGLLSAVALGLVGYSLYLVFSGISFLSGFIFLGADLLVLPLVLIFGLKVLAASPLSLRRQLSSSDGVVSQAAGLDAYLNQQGRAITALRPSGIALMDGTRLDVVTDGEFIEPGTLVTVTAVTGNQIIVARATDPK